MNKGMKLALITTFLLLSIVSVSAVSAVNNTTGLADSPWPKDGQNLNNTGQSPNDGPKTNTTSWTTGGYTFTVESPVIGPDGTIYIGSTSDLLAYNPDGTFKWWYTFGTGLINGTPAVGADGTIYTGGGTFDNKFYAINPNRTTKWIYNNTSAVCGSPTIGDDGTIYFGSGSTLYALNPNGTSKWISTLGGTIGFGSPAIGTDGTIYVGCTDNKLYAILNNGTEKWNYTAGGAFYSSPAIGADGTLYIGNEDGKLYAIYSNGTKKWNSTIGGSISNTPAIATNRIIYVGSNNNNLYAINPTNGTVIWNSLLGGSIKDSPTIGADGIIYVACSDNKWYALNSNGSSLWNYTGANIKGSPIIGADGTLYALTSNSLIALHDPPVIVNLNTSATYNSIQEAIDDADPDDVISVGVGPIWENVIVDKRVVLSALGTIIRPVTRPWGAYSLPVFTVTSDGSGSTIEGFFINGTGIVLVGTENVTIYNNTFDVNQPVEYIEGDYYYEGFYGVILVDSDNNQINGNSFNTTAIEDRVYGIYLENSNNTNINNNTINTIGYAGGVDWESTLDEIYTTIGVFINKGSSNNNLTDNIITTGYTYSDGYEDALIGVLIVNGCNDNNITGNTINTTGDIYAYGVAVLGGLDEGWSPTESTGNVISYNTIDTAAQTSLDLQLLTGSNGSTVQSNYFYSNGEQALDDGSGNTWDGNYYDGWLPGTPREIAGSAKSVDENPI